MTSGGPGTPAALATPTAKGSAGPGRAGGGQRSAGGHPEHPSVFGRSTDVWVPSPKEHPRLFSHAQVTLSSRDDEPWKFGGE